ncbi:YbcC family protein [Erythrobacter sp. R86502]|uniref:YbcC family protein n=1 Tax=Erythrobacter sp. R86502 TaxID=3093846 RepID=UPI0036D228C5
MPSINSAEQLSGLSLHDVADAAARAIAPLWPLASSVAVNPFLGQAGLDLAGTAALLSRVSSAATIMPRAWFAARLESGMISDDDLAAALDNCGSALRPGSVAALKLSLQIAAPARAPLPTIADLAAEVSGIDWPAIIDERFGHWAASWWDEGQALWAAPKRHSAFRAWQAVATHDLTPEIAGLHGFAAFVADAPDSANEAIARSVALLDLPAEAWPTYFHALLITLGGWAQYARYQQWQAELGGGKNSAPTELLCIRLIWEAALFAQYEPAISAKWRGVMAAHAVPSEPDADHIIDAILQDAAERSAQRALGQDLKAGAAACTPAAPVLQAAFCIDVRSETFRRALESLDPGICTLGFAGFFGIGASHRRFASDVPEHRLPVLLNASVTSRSGTAQDEAKDRSDRYLARARRAWGRFKLAAVSSFAFVEATGPLYFGKLVRDSLALKTTSLPRDPLPVLDPPLALDQRIAAACAVLRAMSLTSEFAPLVLLVGHGANVVNNPHASGLHCGACGGYSGEVNARLLASLLNDPEVRAGLAAAGISVPAETLFLGALHDTTADEVLIYGEDHPSPAHADGIAQAREWLASAGLIARSERALRLPRAGKGKDISRRTRDWAEIRPEWALAGCKAFIAAPRVRTGGTSLNGRAFLHDYVWQQDEGFGVLELIMTAPVVVASWISLQYYGSSVDPEVWGGGNKLIHNVIGGIGVVEGNGGTLRGGLPWQSVHDGEKLVHEPLRLTVCIEAPVKAMTEILARHDKVRALFDNRWLHLIALDDEGQMAWRYTGDLDWEKVDPEGRAAPPEMIAA